MNYNNSKGQLTYQIEVDKQQKNGFPIPCTFKSTGKIGVIYPTQALEVTYGDTINNTSMAGVQFNPLAVPIMANMQVKQEHYYVPFIDVWENWDNFISGGEDLNFTTPPPAVSFERVMSVLNGLLSLNLDYIEVNAPALGADDIHMTEGKYFYVELPAKGTIFPKLYSLYAKVQMYGVDDINRHFIMPAYDNLEKFFQNQRDIILEYERTHSNPVGDCHITPEIFYREVDGESKYYILLGCELNAQLKLRDDSYSFVFPSDYQDTEQYENYIGTFNAYKNSIGSTLSDKFRFTPLGLEYIQKLYKPYQPFVGVGSYMDCLNMGCLTEEHFQYLWYSSFAYAEQNQSSFVIRTELLSDLQLRMLELRSLYLIWYNNYRDQLLETSAIKPRRDDTITDDELFLLLIPRVRCWDKDSYTTALDNPATADAVVPVGNGSAQFVYTRMQNIDGYVGSYVSGVRSEEEIGRNQLNVYSINFGDGTELLRIPTGYITGLSPKDDDLHSNYSGSFSLHMLDAVRRAQKFMRKALFYGNRIQDFIYSNFAVKYLDARLRLPELLATSVDTAELQTLVNNTTIVTEQSSTVAGDRAGFAKAYDKGNYFSRFCEESGLIMSLFTVMPEPTYAYGQSRQYSKLDRFDYPFPDFATLGMDAVYDNELTAMPVKVAVDSANLSAYPKVFGYQGRYYDKKFRQSTEHGELLTTQDMYTFGRKWNMLNPTDRPLLNAEFVHCFPPLDMFVMEDGTEDYFRFDIYHDTTAELQLPYHSIYM